MLSSYHIRRIILEQSKRAHVGHIGSCLSVADIITSLYHDVLNIASPDDPDRDRFVLSKGHAALALYAALYLKGWISAEQLNMFHGNRTQLSVHPEHQLAGVDFTTGSLGQGLSMGVGAALAARLQGSGRRVFVLISDAEMNEGSVWEAAMFAAHHRLANLIVIIDYNKQQAFGYTREVLDTANVAQRWRAFCWDAHEIDGHDVEGLSRTMRAFDAENSAPHVLIAHTTFGSGVSYMENQIRWHYMPMSDEEFSRALEEIKIFQDGS